MPKFHIKEISEELLNDFFSVFEGDLCENCQCTYFHKADKKIDWQTISTSITRKWREEISKNSPDGYLFYADEIPIGWCQCSFLSNFPYIRDIFDGLSVTEKALIISCLFIKKEYRGKNLSKRLVEKIIKIKKLNGENEILAMPASEEEMKSAKPGWAEVAMHTGSEKFFRYFQFEEIGRTSRYVLMKLNNGSSQ